MSSDKSMPFSQYRFDHAGRPVDVTFTGVDHEEAEFLVDVLAQALGSPIDLQPVDHGPGVISVLRSIATAPDSDTAWQRTLDFFKGNHCLLSRAGAVVPRASGEGRFNRQYDGTVDEGGAGWEQHYTAKKYHAIDPTIDIAQLIDRPAVLTWEDVESERYLDRFPVAGKVTQRAKDMFNAARHFGLHEGLMIYDRTVNLGICAMMVAGDEGFLTSRPRDTIAEFVQVARTMLRRMDELSYSDDETAFDLPKWTTPRLEVLKLLQRGWSPSKIAQTLDKSVRTVEDHIEATREQLGGISRTELQAFLSRSQKLR